MGTWRNVRKGKTEIRNESDMIATLINLKCFYTRTFILSELSKGDKYAVTMSKNYR